VKYIQSVYGFFLDSHDLSDVPGLPVQVIITFRAYLDRNVIYPGQSAQLSLEFQGTSGVKAPEVQAQSGLQIRYSGTINEHDYCKRQDVFFSHAHVQYCPSQDRDL